MPIPRVTVEYLEPGNLPPEWHRGGYLLVSMCVWKDHHTLFKRTSIDPKLRGLEPFGDCSDRELRDIARLRTRVAKPVKRVLAREGRTAREFVVITEGTAIAFRDGNEVGRLGRGDHFGEQEIMRGICHESTIVACTPVQLEVMSFPEFWGAYQTTASFRAWVDATLVALDRRMAARVATRDLLMAEPPRVPNLVGYTLASRASHLACNAIVSGLARGEVPKSSCVATEWTLVDQVSVPRS